MNIDQLREELERDEGCVNEIYKDPLLWWNSKDVQDVREKFCYRFARTSKNWVSELQEELQKLIK